MLRLLLLLDAILPNQLFRLVFLRYGYAALSRLE